MTQPSRLMFSGLPPDLTEDKLKAGLLKPAELASVQITDLRLNRNRHIAFVGFKTLDQAHEAKKYFHRSYAFGGTFKLKVEFVEENSYTSRSRDQTGPTPAQIAWDRQQARDKAIAEERRLNAKKAAEKADGSDEDDEASDQSDGPGPSGAAAADAGQRNRDRRMRGMEKEQPVASGSRAGQRDIEAPLEKQYTRMQLKALEYKAKKDAEDQEKKVQAAWVQAQKPAETPGPSPEEQSILKTRRLFIRNLPFVTTLDEVREHFSTIGETEEVYMPVAKAKGTHETTNLATAFVSYKDPKHAVEAYRKLKGTYFQGRKINVIPADYKLGEAPWGRKAREAEAAVDGKVLGKIKLTPAELKKKLDAKKGEASQSGINWATMYMDSDSVAANAAKRLGVSKADLLDGKSGNPAVLLALAETEEIMLAKKYFEDHGINIKAFTDEAGPRSPTTILAKGLKQGTPARDILDKFESFGRIKKSFVVPSGMFAIIEFEDADEARLAFTELNNTTMTGGKKMYLERGPVGLFKDASKEPSTLPEGTADGDGPTDESGPTLYIKNLSFSTTTEQLISKVSHLPGFVFARVHMKENPKKGGARLSAGYGFAGFRNLEQATSALAKLQGYELDGKTLQVNFSKRDADDAEPRRGKGELLRGNTKSTKLMVKNVPFEAKKEDLRTLFNAHGRVKSVRMPKKAVIGTSGSLQPKGFAFIDFSTHDEAKRAMEALKATHLYGRHLVTQFAAPEDDADVGALREKTGREWTGLQRAGEGVRTKKRKIGQGDGDEEMDGLE